MSKHGTYIGRFAPSPSGPLHFGSMVAALGSYLDARHYRGQWLLRIEDVDRPRVVPGAEDAIFRTLETFGLEWDGAVVCQRDREQAYAAALSRLKEGAGSLPVHVLGAKSPIRCWRETAAIVTLVPAAMACRRDVQPGRGAFVPHPGKSASMIPCRAGSARMSMRMSVISFCFAQTDCLPISLRSWSMMPMPVSRTWRGGGPD